MARPDDPESVYLDSNALIYAVLQKSGHEPVSAVLSLADRSKLKVLASPLILVEVRGQGRSDPYDEELDRRVLSILDSPRLLLVEFHRGVALRARQYAYKYRLKNYDAIHLASAVEASADVFMTWDSDFPQGSSIDGVWVDEPYEPGESPLPGL